MSRDAPVSLSQSQREAPTRYLRRSESNGPSPHNAPRHPAARLPESDEFPLMTITGGASY